MINNNIWLRTATTNDVASIHAVLTSRLHATYDERLGRDMVRTMIADWDDPNLLHEEINKPQSEYIVADDGKSLHGVAHALSGALVDQPDTVLIRQLCVCPTSQNMGIGSTLLQELETCFPAARRFRVLVFEQNERGVQFFTRRGYEQVKAAGQDLMSYDHALTVILEKEMR